MSFLGLRLGPNIQYDPYTSSMAQLSQLQWQQAMNLSYPVEDQLIRYATDPGAAIKARAQAQTGADAAFSGQAQAQQRQLGLMGVTPTGAQAAAMSKSAALAKAAGEAGAMNQAVAGTVANQTAAMQGT